MKVNLKNMKVNIIKVYKLIILHLPKSKSRTIKVQIKLSLIRHCCRRKVVNKPRVKYGLNTKHKNINITCASATTSWGWWVVKMNVELFQVFLHFLGVFIRI